MYLQEYLVMHSLGFTKKFRDVMTVAGKLFDLISAEHADSDIKVVCVSDNHSFFCHKLILAQHERFRSYPSFNESVNAELHIQDFGSSLVNEVLRFIYTGTIESDPSLVVDLWRCFDYFLVDEEKVSSIMASVVSKAPKSVILSTIVNSCESVGGDVCTSFVSICVDHGLLTTHDFISMIGYTDWSSNTILTLVNVLPNSFSLLDGWFRSHPTDDRVSTFEQGLKSVLISPSIFSKLYGHPYFNQSRGWRFGSSSASNGHEWTTMTSVGWRVLEDVSNVSVIKSPAIDKDQEEAYVVLGLHRGPVFIGFSSHAETLQSVIDGNLWMHDKTDACGIGGWLMCEPGKEHDCLIASFGSHDHLADSKVYLMETNDVVICSTRTRNSDHSVTYGFQLHVNGAKRSSLKQPLRYTTGRSIPVHFVVACPQGNLDLQGFPINRSFIYVRVALKKFSSELGVYSGCCTASSS